MGALNPELQKNGPHQRSIITALKASAHARAAAAFRNDLSLTPLALRSAPRAQRIPHVIEVLIQDLNHKLPQLPHGHMDSGIRCALCKICQKRYLSIQTWASRQAGPQTTSKAGAITLLAMHFLR